ncbi:CubicO group peptidase (beta-lactamase class C family) [Mycobacterium sp. MAA66]
MTQANVAEVNLDANTESVNAAIDAGLLAGAVTLVWQDGQVLQAGALGHRDVDARLPMERDTVFRIASMSKPITVAAAMTLVDEGRLALSDPISQWVPELANPRVMTSLTGSLEQTVPVRRPITIDDLMTHRSGLAYGFSVPPPLSRAYTKIQTLQDPDRWLAALGELPLAHQPGEQLTYSQSTDVLGFILSRIEGKPLPEVLAERIFGPLGMVDTGFAVTASGRRRAATMYQLVPAGDGVTLQPGSLGPPQVVLPTFSAGGGGLWSTADDYLAFARMLLGDGEVDGIRVLSKESARVMRTDRLTAEQKSQQFLGAPFWIGRGFGLNLSVVTDDAKSRPFYGPGGIGTFSWPGAYGTWWQADPSANLIVIYLIQNQPELNVDAAAAVAGNTSLAKLRSAQPKFVKRTYQALGL